MLSIKWCHFQWPWTNPNPVFNVTSLFGASYYRRRIGNRSQAFKWHQFQWPWVTFKPDFKVTVYSTSNNSQMVQDRAILQWRTNRKSYMVYRTAPFSMTLTDPKPRFQGHTILWRWISPKWLQILWKAHRKLYPSFQMLSVSAKIHGYPQISLSAVQYPRTSGDGFH